MATPEGLGSVAETMAEVPIPEAIVGAFIGKGGSGLRHLGRTSGCKINMPRREAGDQSTERNVQLTGTPERVQQGLLLLQQMLGQLAQQASGVTGVSWDMASPRPVSGKRSYETYSTMPMMPQNAMQQMQSSMPMQSGVGVMPAAMGMPSAMAMQGAMGMQNAMGMQGGACMGMQPQHSAGYPLPLQACPGTSLMPPQAAALAYGMQGGMGAPSGAAVASAIKLVIDDSKVGMFVGKGGSGLSQLRELSGANIDLQRQPCLGGRLLCIRPPMVSALRCLGLVCTKLSSVPGAAEAAAAAAGAAEAQASLGVIGGPMGLMGAAPPPTTALPPPPASMYLHEGAAAQQQPLFGMPGHEAAQLKLMLLLPGASVGKVVGKGGIGLKLMREKHAVTIDLRRDDFGGERLLSLSGSVQAVYNAAAEALEERSEARP